MSRLAEILALSEFVEPKPRKVAYNVYCENPYGGGFDHEALKRGEVIPLDDGNEAEFVSSSEDGKLVVTKVDGQLKKFKPAEVGCKILPVGADTSKDSAFVKESNDDADLREKMIDRIEGFFGTLESIPYSKVSTADLKTIYQSLLDSNQIRPFR